MPLSNLMERGEGTEVGIASSVTSVVLPRGEKRMCLVLILLGLEGEEMKKAGLEKLHIGLHI